MVDLLREVDEALRADRAANLWRQYRKTVLTIAAAIVLGTAAHSGWQHYREAKGGEWLLQLSEGRKLLDSGKTEEAITNFASVASETRGETKALAQVWQARALVVAERHDEAKTLLKAAAVGNGLWADIACLRLAGLDAGQADCLVAAHASPLAAVRGEWATAGLWQKGEREAALANLEKMIVSPTTSQDARGRLMQWQAVMKAQEKK